MKSPWDMCASIALRVALTVYFSMHWLKEAVDFHQERGRNRWQSREWDLIGEIQGWPVDKAICRPGANTGALQQVQGLNLEAPEQNVYDLLSEITHFQLTLPPN